MSSTLGTPPVWWQSGAIYQVYPRSFQDSNGDGIGDLQGIRSRLDYLVALGIDAIWISPFFPSPMADFGYDISDYCGVDPIFGTLGDFDRLIADAHERGVRVILDFVPNHTSDRHPWFAESCSGRSSPKRDWYIWRDPAPGGGPPNNWTSNFGGSAWEYDELSGQYYYHAFLKAQPDLNWRNPQVRAAMMDALRFWLAHGVDGFRVDVIWHLIKDAEFRDNPPNPAYGPGQPDIARFLQVYSTDQPEVLDIIAQMRATLDEHGDKLLIGEIYLPVERLVAYYGPELSGVHLPFNFQLIHAPWNARGLDTLIETYERALPAGAWPNWVLSNHDQRRISTRVGAAQARVAAMLLLTLRGTPTIYYGDELGLEDAHIPPDAAQDPWEKNEPGLGLGRDPARTPMRWTSLPGAGFTEGVPWLPIGGRPEQNVADQMSDPDSMLHLYHRLLKLRRAHEALSLGKYESVVATGDILAYWRRNGEEGLMIVLNLGHKNTPIELGGVFSVLASTHPDSAEEAGPGIFVMRPDEGLLLKPR
jgi:alpha-glucosidase